MRCELCGTPVEVVKGTELTYTPLVTPEAASELKRRADAMADYLAALEVHMPDEPIPCLDAYRDLVNS